MLARPTSSWLQVSIVAVVVFLIAFSVDFPLKRLIRAARAIESRQAALDIERPEPRS